ncbi:hypothetical protein GWM83_01305, partial [Candidatus Bathyarchaeota archaeon]|nr:hypothetical protein [Candidatus Bathyarchaeota archaeon]
MERLKHGKEAKDAMDELKEMAKSDLLVRLDYTAFAKELRKSSYTKTVKNIEKGIKDRNVEELTKVYDDLLADTEFPNRSMLLK